MRGTRRLPRSGNSALAATALIQSALGIEFVLAGTNKLLDANLVGQFQSFIAAQPGSSTGVLAPIVQALILPHPALAAYLAGFTEFAAGGVLLLSTLEVWRRRFSGRLGAEHAYELPVALASALSALAVASLSLVIYLLQGGGWPTIGAVGALDSPIAIQLFLMPVAVGIAWFEFGRFLALRDSLRSRTHAPGSKRPSRMLRQLRSIALLLLLATACGPSSASTASPHT
jgi:hypothetical protein